MLSVIAELYPDEFRWRESDSDRPPFIDLLWGSSALRQGIDAGATASEIVRNSPAAPTAPESALLYQGQPNPPGGQQ